jgi:hypothetical protein
LRFAISGRGRRLARERERKEGRKEDGSESRQGVETTVPEAVLHFLIACL